MSDHMLRPGQIPSEMGQVDPIASPNPEFAKRADYDPTPASTTKYYYLETRNASMMTTQGKRIPFIHNIAALDIALDQRYLDNEIENGTVPHLRHASPDEINHFKMLTNPKAVIREQVQEELLADPALQRQMRQRVLDELLNSGAEVPEDLRKFILADPTRPNLESDQGGSRTETVSTNQSTMSALERLKLGGAASVKLTGIQSTEDIKNAAGSPPSA